MDKNKIETITNLFEGNKIRSVWDGEKEEYYFSVVDVIKALTDSNNPRNYWNMLKKRITEEEKSELYTKCVQLKMQAQDGKMRETDTLDTKGIFRLIESVPSPKAEPFKIWLASLGNERVNEIFDPSAAINRAVQYYRDKGYSDDWIEKRIRSIINRKKLTDGWKSGGISEDYEYAVLTNEIYREWSGMNANEYKILKGIRKESLRDNMSEIEVALTDLGEIAVLELIKKRRPMGLKENMLIAREGGGTAKIARDDLERKLGETIINSVNDLSYSYIEEKEEDF